MNQIILNIEKSEASENLTESDIIRRTTDIFRAIGHVGRLKILYNLIQSEKTVSMLERALPYKQAAISQQLAQLRFSGIVKCRREGKMIYYKIANEKIFHLLTTIRDKL